MHVFFYRTIQYFCIILANAYFFILTVDIILQATEESELSPSSKNQKRCFESTFTPKMRTRTFSVKRFKRKKSEGKLSAKEASSTLFIEKLYIRNCFTGTYRTGTGYWFRSKNWIPVETTGRK